MTDGPQYPQYPGEQPQQPVPAQPTVPPPPGYAAPPPAGYNPPPQPGVHPPPAGYRTAYPPAPMAAGQFASWGSRVGAYLLDTLFAVIAFVPFMVAGFIILGTTGTTSTDVNGEISIEGASPVGYAVIGLGYVALLAFVLWNYVFRQGASGQTFGKSIVGIKVVRESGEPRLGRGLALGRMLLTSILTSFTCYLNLLWPLWDAKKQTLHDKVVSTVVVRV